VNLNESARKVRQSSEREHKSRKSEKEERANARRDSDTASAEAFPEIVKHKHNKGQPSSGK
jgi:hypothetical protein